MGRVTRAAVRWIRRSQLCVAVIGMSAIQNSGAAELTVKAQGTEYTLLSSLENQSFDGAKSRVVVFTDHNRVFRYTPPAGWQVQTAGTKVLLSRGQSTATLVVRIDDRDRATSSAVMPEQLKAFQQETATRASALTPVTATLTTLPFRIADQPVVESTAVFTAAGQPQVLQRLQTFGGIWRLEAEISGSKKQFENIATEFIQSLCSVEVQTGQELQVATSRKQTEALASLALARPEVSKDLPRTRGRIP